MYSLTSPNFGTFRRLCLKSVAMIGFSRTPLYFRRLHVIERTRFYSVDTLFGISVFTTSAERSKRLVGSLRADTCISCGTPRKSSYFLRATRQKCLLIILSDKTIFSLTHNNPIMRRADSEVHTDGQAIQARCVLCVA